MMDIALNKGRAVIRTPFSPTHDLVQAFSGLGEAGTADPNPIDFAYAALVKRACRDIWHADQVLALSTDEAPPMLVNGADIGGHHAQACAVRLEAGKEGWALSDVGTLWQDEQGIAWTCVRVLSGRHALFVSDNIGPSQAAYAFSPAVSGSLCRREDGRRVSAAGQKTGVPMGRAVRVVSRALSVRIGGAWQPVTEPVTTGCGMARIEDDALLINPATVTADLRRRRPAGGYAANPDLASFGTPMLRLRQLFTLHPDGTAVISFRHEARQPVAWQGFLALMYQEKCCPPGGSVKRYIPGLRPLRQGARRWDFSLPVDLARPFPDAFPVTPVHWARVSFPPDRQIEQIRGRRGQCVSFAAGILPLGDGAPRVRAEGLREALTLVPSRKAYLTFCGTGNPADAGEKGPLFTCRQGTVYRKYYPSPRDASLYAIPAEGKTYLYVDFMAAGSGPALRQEYPCPAEGDPAVLSRDGDIQWTRENGVMRFSGRRGFAVFALPDPPHQLQNGPE